MSDESLLSKDSLAKWNCKCDWRESGGGGNAIYAPYGDVPPIRVYFLAFDSKTVGLFSSLTLKQSATFVLSLKDRVYIHSTFTVSKMLILVLMFSTYL